MGRQPAGIRLSHAVRKGPGTVRARAGAPACRLPAPVRALRRTGARRVRAAKFERPSQATFRRLATHAAHAPDHPPELRPRVRFDAACDACEGRARLPAAPGRVPRRPRGGQPQPHSPRGGPRDAPPRRRDRTRGTGSRGQRRSERGAGRSGQQAGQRAEWCSASARTRAPPPLRAMAYAPPPPQQQQAVVEHGREPCPDRILGGARVAGRAWQQARAGVHAPAPRGRRPRARTPNPPPSPAALLTPTLCADDIGGAFGMGALGGGLWHTYRGLKNSPKGYKIAGTLEVRGVAAARALAGGGGVALARSACAAPVWWMERRCAAARVCRRSTAGLRLASPAAVRGTRGAGAPRCPPPPRVPPLTAHRAPAACPQTLRRESPRIGGNFANWGLMFSVFDCSCMYIRQKVRGPAGAWFGSHRQAQMCCVACRPCAARASAGPKLLLALMSVCCAVTCLPLPSPQEDPFNAIMAGALTGGFLQIRSGLKPAFRSAVFGGVLLVRQRTRLLQGSRSCAALLLTVQCGRAQTPPTPHNTAGCHRGPRHHA